MKNPLFVLLIVCMFSCKKSGNLSGNWATDVDTPFLQGFTLLEDGTVSTVNPDTKQYNAWKEQDGLLILSGSNVQDAALFADTLKIISVGDSTLVIETGGQQISYSRSFNPQKQAAAAISECFIYQIKQDSAFLQIETSGGKVAGDLFYSFFEKDKNQGKIAGEMKGDTLLATYTFNSEGMESRREVAFIKIGDNWIEGFGDVTERSGTVTFKDRSKLNFKDGLEFRKTKCP